MILPRLSRILIVIYLIQFSACSGGNKEETAKESSENASSNLMKQAEELKDDGKGIGPIKNLELTASIDENLAAEGQKYFETKCMACHRFSDERMVGPGLKGITRQRKPEWIMNMMMNPMEMTHSDPAAKELLAQFMTQMTDQNVSENEARAILEFFRKGDAI